MQSVDYTTLIASCAELQSPWIPARLEQVYQCDRYTIALALRTINKRGWLTISWHPQAARICIGDAPPKTPDTFTFSDQLRHQLNGYALTAIEAIAPWERVIDCQFAKRPGDPPVWHLYTEIMGKYSNVILTDASNQIITVAHQVTASQSSVRTVQTGQPYQLPPPLFGSNPSLEESFGSWQERVSLIPDKIERQLIKTYRGVSPVIARFLLKNAKIDSHVTTDQLTQTDWEILFQEWQNWLNTIKTTSFQPGWTDTGYTVLGGDDFEPVSNVQTLLNRYYTDYVNQETFRQLRHQLSQKINASLEKLRQKANTFTERLQQSENADQYRQQADLLMAYVNQWEAGMNSITLPDFETEEPVKISLNPEKNGVQNAQSFYKQHQKLKRAKQAVQPLLNEVLAEIQYLEQVSASLSGLEQYQTPDDLQTLEEIRDELIEQNYFDPKQPRPRHSTDESQPRRYSMSSGLEIWIGRNNRQNDYLTFRTAGDYDLWFHTQEIAGSHVLLRLPPGSVPDESDLQLAADWAAYFSQARQSSQVPVVYTKPKYVYKPKGAKPGMVIYKQEQVLWGSPQRVTRYLKNLV
jgi:predicted ribosome quality control (RQC) complex YloA/Tae2 family protein